MNRLAADTEQAKRLMAMGQMAASLAHEIRNPLGSMELYCSLLKKDLVDNPDLRSMAENIHAGIRTLDRIISNCLQFARDIEPKMQRVDDVRVLLKESIEYAQARDKTKSVEFKLSTLGDGEVYVDTYLIKQVFTNVVMNAMEAAQCNAVQCDALQNKTPQVLIVSNLCEQDLWNVTVSDNGVGISNDIRGVIFDPFFSTKQEGTGLGLAVVHSIVNAHHGSISIGGEVGVGAEVIVSLPRVRKNNIEN